ncbi:MAG: J domain-containing protein [Nannocystaceae bacterium]
MSGADEAELLRLHAGLAIATYYDFLGLRPGCDYVAVREAFHARAQRYHPDRFVVGGDAERRQLAYEVYKRMTEAYQVLCDPELRAAYDEARLRGQTRLSEVARARRLGPDERQVSNTFARIYLRAARGKLARGDLRGAWIDVKLGLGLEQAPPLLALLDEIRSHPGALSLTSDAGRGGPGWGARR